MGMQQPAVVKSAYPSGPLGGRLSVRLTAAYAAAGRVSPEVAAWARKAIGDAGRPGGKAGQATALLERIRLDKFYIPDPAQAEMMVSPQCFLEGCEGIEWDGGDCDDLSASLAAALESVDIPTAIVGQSFSNDKTITHVLVAVALKDSDGIVRWLYADPSDPELQFGQSRQATTETWVSVRTGKVVCANVADCAATMDGIEAPQSSLAHGDFVGVGEAIVRAESCDRECGCKSAAVWGFATGVGAALLTWLATRGLGRSNG